jgi:hypothetical protein
MRGAGLRDGTRNEYQAIRTIEFAMLGGLAAAQRLGGAAKDRVSRADRRAAQRRAGRAQERLDDLVIEQLELAGVRDLLRAKSFKEVSRQLLRRLDRNFEGYIEQRIRQRTGIGIALGVPLREQIARAAEGYVSRLVSGLAVQAGPALLVIRLISGGRLDPTRLVALAGRVLREALRRKGNLVRRQEVTVRRLDEILQAIVAYPPNGSLAGFRKLLRRGVEAVSATHFLERDLRKRPDQLTELVAARQALEAELGRWVALAVSQPFGRDLGALSTRCRQALTEAEKVLAALPPGGPPTPPGEAVCVPRSFAMQSGQAQYAAQFQALRTRNRADGSPEPFVRDCLWRHPTDNGEVFVAFVTYIPPNTPGAVESGNCHGTRSDSPGEFHHSRTRYLTVSGGHRRQGEFALGGNATVLSQVLQAAEAAGVGEAC